MKIRCKHCETIIEGDNKGTYITCKCGKVAIDQTPYYVRVNGDPQYIEELDKTDKPVERKPIEKDKITFDISSKNIYIFLDIDGVLNNERYLLKCYEKHHKMMNMLGVPFDPLCLNNLMLLCQYIEQYHIAPKIILSSSWRQMNSGKEIVDARLCEYGLSVYDETPVINYGADRGKEIVTYLENNPDFQNFLILDDEDLSITTHIDKKHLIKTTYKNGFNTTCLRKAKNMFYDCYMNRSE